MTAIRHAQKHRNLHAHTSYHQAMPDRQSSRWQPDTQDYTGTHMLSYTYTHTNTHILPPYDARQAEQQVATRHT